MGSCGPGGWNGPSSATKVIGVMPVYQLKPLWARHWTLNCSWSCVLCFFSTTQRVNPMLLPSFGTRITDIATEWITRRVNCWWWSLVSTTFTPRLASVTTNTYQRTAFRLLSRQWTLVTHSWSSTSSTRASNRTARLWYWWRRAAPCDGTTPVTTCTVPSRAEGSASK